MPGKTFINLLAKFPGISDENSDYYIGIPNDATVKQVFLIRLFSVKNDNLCGIRTTRKRQYVCKRFGYRYRIVT